MYRTGAKRLRDRHESEFQGKAVAPLYPIIARSNVTCDVEQEQEWMSFFLLQVALKYSGHFQAVFLLGFGDDLPDNCFVKARRQTEEPQPNLTPEARRKRTFDRAVKLISAKSRSIAELRERLLEKQWANETDVETVISRLKEYGYLDDERFALSYASLKVKQRPVGRRRLERDLKFKKVESSVADEALELVYAETPEEELIDRAIEKRIRLRGRPTNRLEAKSLFDHLLRQGFPFDLVAEKVRAAAKGQLDEE